MLLTDPKSLALAAKFTLPEVNLPSVLPSGDEAAWMALLHAQHQAHTEAMRQAMSQAMSHIQYLLEQFVLARHRHFGVSSEQGQGRLFDEAEALAAETTEAQDIAPIPAQVVPAAEKPAIKARGKRAPLPAELPRVEIVHDVPEAARTCPCGTAMVVIGQQVSEQLDIVPMQYACCGIFATPMVATAVCMRR